MSVTRLLSHSSKMMDTRYQNTWCHICEDSDLYRQHHENPVLDTVPYIGCKRQKVFFLCVKLGALYTLITLVSKEGEPELMGRLESCILSFGVIPRASEFYVPTFRNNVHSIFICGISRKNNWDEIIDGTERVFRNVGT